MKLKILFGIIIPALVVLVLAALGSLDIGFSIKKDFEQQINFSEIFKKSYSNNAIRIGEIQIMNDYFLPKRFDVPAYLACVYDKDKTRPLQAAGSIYYNEGEYSEEVKVLDSTKLSSGRYYPYYYNNKNYKTNIEIGSQKSKKLQVYYLSNRNNYGYQKDLSEKDYDYLILAEQKTNSQIYCESLSSEDLQKAIKITIDKPINYCYDSDENYDSNSGDYYNLRNKLSALGTCNDNNEVSNSDYCQNSESIVEYSCGTEQNQKCSSVVYNCKSYGFNKCENGVCVI